MLRAALCVALCGVALTQVGTKSERSARALDDTVAHRELSTEIVLSTSGPLGSVSIIGDSVLQGAGLFAPSLPDRLAERGWGPIRFRAGIAYSTGHFDRSFELTATHWFEQWAAEGWVAENVIVNLGTNDTEFCGPDVACSRLAILHVVDAIDPGARVWWPKITKTSTHTAHAAAWNTALDLVAAERENVFTWDWPTEFATGPYQSNDNTHLFPDSYRLRSLRMAEEFTRRIGRARQVGGPVDVGVALGAASTWDASVEPGRIADTRRETGPTGGQPLAPGQVLRVGMDGRVPPETTAVAVYVAAADPTGPGHVSLAPCTADPATAALTFGGTNVGAPSIVAVDENAPAVCATVGGPAGTRTHVVVDLQGAFVEGVDGLRLRPLAPPVRLRDTRIDDPRTSPTSPVEIAIPGDVRAAVLNLASVGATSPGFLVAHPCDSAAHEAGTANLNYVVGPARSALAIVEVAADGTVCVSASSPTEVVVDLTATFTEPPVVGSGSAGAALVPIDPLRVLDTRDGTGGWSPAQGAGQTIVATVGPGWAEAVSGTVTMVRPDGGGFLQATTCGDPPAVASVNGAPGTNVSNGLTTGLDGGGTLCVRASHRTHTVVDVTGWWVDAGLVEGTGSLRPVFDSHVRRQDLDAS